MMCGRFTLRARINRILDEFALPPTSLTIVPRYNIAPTQTCLVVRDSELVQMRWGLIPAWAKDEKIGMRAINARADTVAEKPMFRAAFKSHRCLVPADGYYEWAKVGTKKVPHLFEVGDEDVFGFAGLWERWEPKDAAPVESFTIITTEPNSLGRAIHDRMPVIIPPERYDDWLEKGGVALLKPFPAKNMRERVVSRRVNNARNEGAAILADAE